MRFTRIAVRVGILLVVAFMILVALAIHTAATPFIAALALVGLIACGNLLYGKNSHGAMAKARTRPAQQAQNRAIDEAQELARQQRQQQQQQRHGTHRQSANVLASQFVNQFRRRPSPTRTPNPDPTRPSDGPPTR
jgi:hypothetical protein